MSSNEKKTYFICKDCKNEFSVLSDLCNGFYNWKCTKCGHIAALKDTQYGGVIWKTDTGTVRRREFRQKHKRKG